MLHGGCGWSQGGGGAGQEVRLAFHWKATSLLLAGALPGEAARDAPDGLSSLGGGVLTNEVQWFRVDSMGRTLKLRFGGDAAASCETFEKGGSGDGVECAVGVFRPTEECVG